jgi:DNA-binding GntR family transcriptional regulator
MTMTVDKNRFAKAKIVSRSELKALAGSQDASRAEFVYRALLEAIRQGRLRQGERIREDEVSEWLNVSRTPVREALHRMQTRGLLSLAAGRGMIVSTLSRPQIIELYAIRELLEGGAAGLAAQHASAVEIDTLWRLTEALEKAGDDYVKGERLNRQFHQTISCASRNRYLMNALDDIGDVLTLLQTGQLPGRCVESLREHTEIVEAIAQRAPEKADAAARNHVREACQAQLRQWTDDVRGGDRLRAVCSDG